MTPDGLVIVHTQRRTFIRGSSVRPTIRRSSELDQAFDQCRADWPADFVMQKYCMERQEEAFRAIQRR